MNGICCLTEESLRLLGKINRSTPKAIADKTYREIESCITKERLYSVLIREFNLNRERQDKVWCYIIRNVWDYDPFDKRRSTTFNSIQSVFMNKLILNGGVYYKEQAIMDKLTSQQLRLQVDLLTKIIPPIILNLSINGRIGESTVYILNPLIIFNINNEKD